MKKIKKILLAILLFIGCLAFSTNLVYAANNVISLVDSQEGTLSNGDSRYHDFELPGKSEVTIYFTKETYGSFTMQITDSKDNVVYDEYDFNSFDDKSYSVTLGKGSYTLTISTTFSIGFDYAYSVDAKLIEKIQPDYLKLDKKNITLAVGKTGIITGRTTVTTYEPKWSSSNSKVASVSKDGVVTAKSFGTAVITVKLGNKKASCNVIVNSVSQTQDVVKDGSISLKKYIANVPNNSKVKWSSSNTKIATVDKDGKVIAKSKGKAKITAKINKVDYTINIFVKMPTISLNKTSATLYVGKTAKISSGGDIKLKATTFPENLDVTWKSKNPSIAKVSSDGKVTALKAGTVTITASIKYKGKTYSKTCKITVKNKAGISINYVDWKVNSVGGIEPYITITNNTKSNIKYINFKMTFYNAVGDKVTNDIGWDSYEKLKITGPFKANTKETFYWDPVFYNNSVHAVGINNVVITYMNGKKEKVKYNMLWKDKYYYDY